MSFIERSLPPGDRDEAPTQPVVLAEGAAAAGRSLPDAVDEKLKTLRAALDEAQLVLGELRIAAGQEDWPAAEACAWRLNVALMQDLRALAHEVRRTITRGRRAAIFEEV